MLSYVIRRILIMIPTLIAISAISFIIIQLPPGDYLSPIRINIQMPKGSGFVVGVSSYAYLFANATGGHTLDW